MRFDIEELVRDWLVSGRKRGDFEARVAVQRLYTISRTDFILRMERRTQFLSH